MLDDRPKEALGAVLFRRASTELSLPPSPAIVIGITPGGEPVIVDSSDGQRVIGHDELGLWVRLEDDHAEMRGGGTGQSGRRADVNRQPTPQPAAAE